MFKYWMVICNNIIFILNLINKNTTFKSYPIQISVSKMRIIRTVFIQYPRSRLGATINCSSISKSIVQCLLDTLFLQYVLEFFQFLIFSVGFILCPPSIKSYWHLKKLKYWLYGKNSWYWRITFVEFIRFWLENNNNKYNWRIFTLNKFS